MMYGSIVVLWYHGYSGSGVLLYSGIMGHISREFKNKPKDMKISVYLIHTRLIAQGTVVGGTWRKYKQNKEKKEKKYNNI